MDTDPSTGQDGSAAHECEILLHRHINIGVNATATPRPQAKKRNLDPSPSTTPRPQAPAPSTPQLDPSTSTPRPQHQSLALWCHKFRRGMSVPRNLGTRFLFQDHAILLRGHPAGPRPSLPSLSSAPTSGRLENARVILHHHGLSASILQRPAPWQTKCSPCALTLNPKPGLSSNKNTCAMISCNAHATSPPPAMRSLDTLRSEDLSPAVSDSLLNRVAAHCARRAATYSRTSGNIERACFVRKRDRLGCGVQRPNVSGNLQLVMLRTKLQ